MGWRRGAGPLDGGTWRSASAVTVKWRAANPLGGADNVVSTQLVPPIPAGVLASRILRNDGGAILLNNGSKLRLN